MRQLSLLIVTLLVVPAAAQENDAEKLFRAMEKKIRAAKSFQMDFEGEVSAGTAKMTVKGKAAFAEKNNCRIEATNEVNGKEGKTLIVADGKTFYWQPPKDNTPAQTRQVVDIDQENWQGFIARCGVLSSAQSFYFVKQPKAGESFDIGTIVSVTDFKLGTKEKVGGKETQIVQFTATIAKDAMKATVWIDPQTQLPVKFALEGTAKAGGRSILITETYSNFTVDSKLDAKTFEIPK
jgi:outer membrane lipoprotein-sorting protein